MIMRISEDERNVGKFLSRLVSLQLRTPFITLETRDAILDGFSELTTKEQSSFSLMMLELNFDKCSEEEMILKSREVMERVTSKVLETD